MNTELEILLNRLTNAEKEELITRLMLETQRSKSQQIFNESAKNNSNCPHCNSNHIVKIGKLHGNQRFKCCECHKNFTITTNTPFFFTKKSFDLWVKYIDLMTKKLSLRHIAEELHINLKTAFYWRHKILKALSSETTTMGGIVEADETYFRESQKGSRNLTRKAHKSGKSKLNKFQIMSLYGCSEEEYKKMQHKRGLSKDLICVLTATDRNNNMFGKPVGYGKVQPNWIVTNLQDKISNNSTLITDGEKSYNLIRNVKHKKFTTGLSKSKTYNLGRIDNIHTSMKGLINHNFRGVATKYLQGYVNYVKMLRRNLNMFEFLIKINSSITQKQIFELNAGF